MKTLPRIQRGALLLLACLLLLLPGLSAAAQTTPTPDEKAIMSLIDAYFAQRYELLSSKTPKAAKPDLSRYTAKSIRTQAFILAEQDKLQLELAHAQHEGLTFHKVDYTLEYQSITVDETNQSARVVLIEGYDAIFESSFQLDPKDPPVTEMRNLEHVILLQKTAGKWGIVSDDYLDYLWRVIEYSGAPKEKLLQLILDPIADPEAPLSTADPKSTTPQTLCNLPADPTSHAYNRRAAADYALKWALARNPAYHDFSNLGGDCTNFVSQAVHNGDAPMAFYTCKTCVGTYGWYYRTLYDRAKAWASVMALWNFFADPGFYPYWDIGPEGCSVAREKTMLADVIQYDWGGDGVWDHAVIITEIRTGTDGKPVQYVSAHSQDFRNVPYTYFRSASAVRYLHIERIDGLLYPNQLYLPAIEN